MHTKISVISILAGAFLLMGCPPPPAPTPIDFISAVQAGGAPSSVSSTSLTLTFSADPENLSADDVTVAGAAKGALSGSGTTRSLELSAIEVDDGATVTVEVASPEGYAISDSPRTAVVYRLLSVGEPYKGGIIAYILQAGDTGYSAGAQHGLIALASTYIYSKSWAIDAYKDASVTTSTAFGTGQANTAAIVAQNGAGTGYAAGLCDDFLNGNAGYGSYSDWYLPSREELNRLYENRTAIGDFKDSNYASSSQYDPSQNWAQNFENGNQWFASKTSLLWVRPVRNF